MNIEGKCHGEVTVELAVVPSFGVECRMDGNTIQVIVNYPDRRVWIPAGWLKTPRDAWAGIFDHLVWKLSEAAAKTGKSKAEVKRELVRMGVIPK